MNFEGGVNWGIKIAFKLDTYTRTRGQLASHGTVSRPPGHGGHSRDHGLSPEDASISLQEGPQVSAKSFK